MSSPVPDLDPTQLLSLRESAQLVRKSTRTIRRWVEAGHLPGAKRMMQQIFVPRGDLLAMYKPARPAA